MESAMLTTLRAARLGCVCVVKFVPRQDLQSLKFDIPVAVLDQNTTFIERAEERHFGMHTEVAWNWDESLRAAWWVKVGTPIYFPGRGNLGLTRCVGFRRMGAVVNLSFAAASSILSRSLRFDFAGILKLVRAEVLYDAPLVDLTLLPELAKNH